MKHDTLAGQLLALGFVSEGQLVDARDRGGQGVADSLMALGHCTREQLHVALSKRAEPGTVDAPRLGEVLIALEYLTDAKLRVVLAAQASDRRPLGQLLVECGACTFDQVYEGLVAQSQAANKHAKVIVVDDSSIVRRVVTRGLVDLGYDVVSFESPHEVLEELEHIKPDIVVTDLEMPGMDGATLCRRLKEVSGNQLPVIILTATESQTATTGLRAGADDYVRKGTSMDELAARIDGILQRARNASHVRKLFARYTSPAVVEQILQADDVVLSGEKRDVSVLFADIRGFTSFSETHEPEDVLSTLNRMLGKLADAVIMHGGTVDKFLGDGLMAVFGAPLRQDDHAERAVAAGHRMLEAMTGETLGVGVAVNSGPVVAGSIGNERRAEYTCIGDVVNVCARLCAIAEPHELLVGHGTFSQIEDAQRFEPLTPVQLKGKANAVPLYRAKPPSR
jgi:adenylate cyclase